MNDLATTCEAAARLGGDVLLRWRKRFTVREKGPADLVTQADLEAQQTIQAFLAERFPDHSFIGEETPDQGRLDTPHCWIVDPLDGTTNYVHDLPNYATSVAVAEQGVIVAGAVFDPVLGECFTAVRGRGARLNGQPIQVSGQTDLGQSLVAVSFPTKLDRHSREIEEMLAVLPYCQAFRRMGSAALNLCYVAAGRMDAYWSTSTKIWDVAAGTLIVSEAGGLVTSPSGGEFDVATGDFLAAASPPLHRRVREILATCARHD